MKGQIALSMSAISAHFLCRGCIQLKGLCLACAASASARYNVPSIVQAWDLATAQCQHTLKHHKGKVQAVAWNPAEASVLLSGGFDKVVAMVGHSQFDVLQKKTYYLSFF